jgi:TonB-linked SusC/RagA family outer membrane protein
LIINRYSSKFFLFAVIAAFGLSTASLFAQPVMISGTVIDAEDNSTLPGVNVFVKGTTNGVTSDANGRYAIEADQGATLVFSFVGMAVQEIFVGNNREINVVMSPESMELEEVVVTGMSQVDKRMFTGAADHLIAGKMMLSGVADITRSLEGRSAGVSIQNVSGTFGTAPKIRIRGATSIYGNSKPLWVVDGVIMEDVSDISNDQLSSGDAVTLIGNSIAGLNADDIESFEILKDGSATSIYGAKAMAGVIVITTKKGRAGSARINYTGEFTSRLKPSYRNFNIMNSQDQMGIYKELEAKGWLNFADVFRSSNSGVYGQAYRLVKEYDVTSGTFGLENTPEAINAYLQKAEMRNTDWFDELFSNAIMMNHSLSLSQGTEKSTSYISMSALTDPGWHKQSKVTRFTLNANAQYRLLDNLTINILGNGSYRKQFAPGTVAQGTDAVGGSVSRDFDINPYSYALNTSRTMGPNDYFIRNYTSFNIFEELEQNYLEFDLADTKFQGEVKWTVVPNFTLGAVGAFKYSTTSMQHHIRDDSNYARAYREMSDPIVRDDNPFLYEDPDDIYGLPVSILESGGFFEKREYKIRSIDFRADMKYRKTFDNTHSVDFYGGMEVNSIDRTSDWFRGIGMQYKNGEIPFTNYLAFKKYREENTNYFSLSNTANRSAAFFGTLTYAYKNRYSVTGTARYEGSNRLGKAKAARWLPTWNVGGAWNIHEEAFFNSLEPVLSHLKLRTSYSLTAQSGPSWVSNSRVVIKNYAQWRPFANMGETGLEISDLENSELTYEKNHEYNLGIDAGFLNNRVNLVFEWYRRNMYDLIGYVTTMGVGGKINKLANTADMTSQGVEVTLSTRNVAASDFQWTSDFTFSYNKSRITKLTTMDNLMNFITGNGFPKEGYNRSSLFSIPFTGLDDEGLPTFSWTDESGDGIAINKANYEDLWFQQTENIDFLKFEGQIDPKVTGGFGNMFSYKNLHLNVFITYAFGNVIRLDPVFKGKYSDMDATPKDFINRWMKSGDEAITDVPVIASVRQKSQYANLDRAYNAYNYSTVRVADGSFVRMKEISLAYDFPKSAIEKLKMQHLSLKFQATNPFLIYSDAKLNGQDPEFFRSGGVAVPMSQQFTLTVKVGF